ncbi:MAG: hypothetical protein HYX71_05490 [Opitutae bacterium]|nr:hypothetical protein [Opitutae bacterium]
MRRITGILCFLLGLTGAAVGADQAFAPAGWAIEARLPQAPGTDAVLTPSPQGDIRATRYFTEQGGERTFLVRFSYPLALLPGEEAGVYTKSFGDMLKSRPGEVKARGKFLLGPFEGERLVIAQKRDRTIREVRLLVVGSTLYLFSAEWPEAGKGAARAEDFFRSIQLKPDYTNLPLVQEKERWRELVAGNFRLRYDAARWYRDPADKEPGVFNLLRVDQRAEAQLIAEPQPIEGSMEAAVINTAREGAENVTLRRRGSKLRGATSLTELEFAARVDNVTYVNHGYFYSGKEGAVQLRGWAKDVEYADVNGDITELLDGLAVSAK